MKRQYFTRIELLIVTTITTFLMAMVLTGGNAVLKDQKRIDCVNNLGKLGKAMASYLDDSGGNFMPHYSNAPQINKFSTWTWVLCKDRYADGTEFICPGRRGGDEWAVGMLTKWQKAATDESLKSSDVYYYPSFGMNRRLLDLSKAGKAIKSNQIADPAGKIFSGDVVSSDQMVAKRDIGHAECHYAQLTNSGFLRAIHNPAVNLLFFDGHVVEFEVENPANPYQTSPLDDYKQMFFPEN